MTTENCPLFHSSSKPIHKKLNKCEKILATSKICPPSADWVAEQLSDICGKCQGNRLLGGSRKPTRELIRRRQRVYVVCLQLHVSKNKTTAWIEQTGRIYIILYFYVNYLYIWICLSLSISLSLYLSSYWSHGLILFLKMQNIFSARVKQSSLG